MGGCLRGIGCLALLAILAVGGWFYRDDLRGWWSRRGGGESAAAAEWQTLTPAGAARARAAVARLERRSGRVYENVAPGDLAAYVVEELSRGGMPPVDSARARVAGDTLMIRALIDVGDLGAGENLGPLGGMLKGRGPVQFGGTLEVIRPGLAQYRVKSLKVRDLSIPAPMIPRLIRRLDRGAGADSLAADGLPLRIPPYIADVRLGGGTVTLIKAAR